MLLFMAGVAAAAATSSSSTDCTTLATHEECTLGHKCKWEEHGIRCMNLDQPHDCMSIMYKDECFHMSTCTWYAPTEQCHDKKDGPLCDLPFLTEDECTNMGDHCQWHEAQGVCAMATGPKRCHAFQHSQDACNAQEGCTFNKAVGACSQDDFVAPCHDLDNELTCLAGEACGWAADDWMCFNTTTLRVCERFFTDEVCAKQEHCEWIKDSAACHRSDLDVSCYRMVNEDDCQSNSHCIWAGQECTDPTNERPCDWSSDDQECLAQGDRCEWDVRAEFCKHRGMVVSCERFLNEDVCDQTDGCKFKQGCFDEESIIPCAEVTSVRHCYKIACEWNREKRTCGDFINKPPNPDGVDPDAPAHNPGDLGEMGDMGDSDSGVKAQGEDGEHVKPDCSEVQCPSIGSDGEGVCEGSDEVWMQSPTECCPRCGYTTTLCSHHTNMDTCPDKCAWHEKYYACLALEDAVSCHLISQSDSCVDPNLRPDQCDWHAEIHACVNKGELPVCNHYQVEEMCAEVERCSWHKHQHVCLDAGGELECKHYDDEANCESHKGCKFDKHVLSCMNTGEVVPCSEYNAKAGCTQDSAAGRCSWYEHKQLCLAKTAKVSCEYRTKFECATVSGCKWDRLFTQCIEVHDFHPLPCSEHGAEQLCAEEGCYWHNAANRCINPDEVVPCKEFGGDWECNNAEGGQACTWDEEAFVCLSPGEKVACDKWFEDAVCTSKKCTWNKAYFACHPPDEEVSCIALTDEDSCEKRDDCKFFFHLCHHVDHKIPCQDYFSEVNCIKQPGCKFYLTGDPPKGLVNNKGPAKPSRNYNRAPGEMQDPFPDLLRGVCGNEDASMCNYVFEKRNCHPRATQGKCAWDSTRHKCRELRMKRDEL